MKVQRGNFSSTVSLNFKCSVPCIATLYHNNPTGCSCAQSVSFHCRVTLHVSGAFHTHHQEYINCIYSLRYRSYIGAATFFHRGRVYFTVTLLYMFRALSTPIIRSTLTLSTASGTGHTSVQLPSSIVAEFISL